MMAELSTLFRSPPARLHDESNSKSYLVYPDRGSRDYWYPLPVHH